MCISKLPVEDYLISFNELAGVHARVRAFTTSLQLTGSELLMQVNWMSMWGRCLCSCRLQVLSSLYLTCNGRPLS